MLRETIAIPVLYLAVSLLSSYKIERFGAGETAFCDEWKAGCAAVVCLLSMAILFFLSVNLAINFFVCRDKIRLYLSVVIILCGSCFAHIALKYRCRDISIWATSSWYGSKPVKLSGLSAGGNNGVGKNGSVGSSVGPLSAKTQVGYQKVTLPEHCCCDKKK